MSLFRRLLEVHSYPSPGRCIYCMRLSEADADLTDEHIVPYGLGGRAVLKKSSCRACASATSRDERFLLRDMLLEARTQLDFPSRRPSDRPSTFKMGVFDAQEDGSFPKNMDSAGFAWRDVGAAERPAMIMLPGFAPPGILWGRAPTDKFRVTGLNAYVDGAARKPDVEPGTQAAVFQKIRPEVVCRVLAKVAHGAAVAELGLAGFQPYLPDLILGRSTNLSHFVGSALSRPRRTAAARYEVTLTLRQGYVIAGVRLFADLGIPPYEIVVGTPTPELGPLLAVSARFTAQ